MTPPPQAATRLIQLDDGRRIACAERGDPAGRPVFAFHGLPGSRLQQHPDLGLAAAFGVRVIHVDRPGFGLSSPQPGRTLASWAGDVAAIADRLELDRFAVSGVSGGGPFALACAALLDGRVTRTAVVSGVGPPGTMHGGRKTMGARTAFYLAAREQWLMQAPLRAAARLAVRSPQRFIDRAAAHLAAADRLMLARPDVRAMLLRDLAESVRQGVDALITDLRLEAHPWNFPLAAIATPVVLWHGEEDWVVPPAAARHLAEAIPGARAKLVPGAGHFMIFDRWAEILDWLIS
ncbi:MAG: alpha/beta fold hydrolase [Bacteroidota bacterium]|nr:alpha/beta hydrolase [Burkholderiales bacterium]